jgi:replicative superfamily II helicase
MVDFKSHLAKKKTEKITDPVKLYDTLDRAHDKGPLRPAQLSILNEWNRRHRNTKDVIVKLHTGQGKTLVGLLMLQARINEGKGPALYLCPDNYLVAQTCEQAKQFGISTCTAEDDIPDKFLNGEEILVTSVQKLFHGLTKFGIKRNSTPVASLLMDDAHACADRIRSACRIRIEKDEPAYTALKALFESELEQQGVGTFADINNEKRDAILPVPYWAWLDHESEVATILSKESARKSIKFSWPILKDILKFCRCVFSGIAVEIEPYVAPLIDFGSYWKAEQRIFMSATVTDDAFLVKGLQLTPETIINPLRYEKESWSGEKMILFPSLIDDELDRGAIVKGFGTPKAKRSFGVVALSPSFQRAKLWEEYGAIVAKSDTLLELVSALKRGEGERALVLANRYDGIDLPDSACRALIFDGRPYSESLVDLYEEMCRPVSEATLMRTVRSVEQGVGRSVRGEKDYCVIVMVGEDLIKLIRDKASRKFFSPQMNAQVEIGLEIAQMARRDIEEGKAPYEAFTALGNQCLRRDEGWKDFYAQEMGKVKPGAANPAALRIFSGELAAEVSFQAGDHTAAVRALQELADNCGNDKESRGWYLQEMARVYYESNRQESNRLQVNAHKLNRVLLKPPFGVSVSRLTVMSQGRVERIRDWIRGFESYEDLHIALSDILGRLVFGAKADKFEQALDELSRALGFAGERPDKEWKEGPDNLWALNDTQYIVWECKSEVDIDRASVNKREAEQMNRSCAWFEKHYPGAKSKNIIIHPAHSLESAAAFTHPVEVMRSGGLRSLVMAVRAFFKSFEAADFKDLSLPRIQDLLGVHKLSVQDLLEKYSRRLKDLK